MDPKLRDLINDHKLHHGLVAEIAAALPTDDGELDALIGETVANLEPHAFLYIVLAALTNGRPADARHLAGGTRLMGHPDWLSCIAWKMQGEVAEHLTWALQNTVMSRELHATGMLVAAAWSMEFREGKLPPGLISGARAAARHNDLNVTQLYCLWAIAEMLKESDLAAVLRATHPRASTPLAVQKSVALGALALSRCREDLMGLIREKPDNFIGGGTHVRRAVARVGRNDPCSCGSGKKYKRCCEEKDKERMRHPSEVAGKTMSELLAEPEPHLTEAMLKKMGSHGVARLDVTKVPERMVSAYLKALDDGLLVDEMAVAFEKLGCETEELKKAWDHLIQTVAMKQRLEAARRMVKVRYPDGEIPDTLYFRVRLLLALEEPERYLKLMNEEARRALTSKDEDVMMDFAYAILFSPNAALGIHCARALIPLISKKLAPKLLHLVEVTRDRLDLPPEEPFGEILEKRFAEEMTVSGKDAEELRKARERLEGKAAEVSQLKETMEQLRRSIRLQEKKMPPTAPAQAPAAEPQELRDLREKVRELKSSIAERNSERATYRRELGQVYTELESLRAQKPAASAPEMPEAEDALLLPGAVSTNQPPRPIEFPRRFHDTLQHLPRQIGRAALIHLGRIAAGEPTAFTGAVRIRAAPDVLRVRVGADHRMLFRLLPECVQLVDLINRRDLERCIEGLG